MSSSTFLGGFRFGLVGVEVFPAGFPCSIDFFFGIFEPVGSHCLVSLPKIRDFALGKCLYATKSFNCAGRHFPYTRGSGTKARPSCLMTLGCLPSSRTHAVCGE